MRAFEDHDHYWIADRCNGCEAERTQADRVLEILGTLAVLGMGLIAVGGLFLLGVVR